MKSYLILLLVMVLSGVNGYAYNSSFNTLSEKTATNIETELQIQSDVQEGLNHVIFGELTTEINDDFSCTRSIKVYVPTTAGLVGLGLSITADTCEEADAGIADAVRGFVNELM
uniref:hypothetical protein n=1 Tax=uncultured Christiangramia sp. TaxID=503836 RepID=UPI002624FC2A|nr:hypothetical protein [uncultured Christiangramia sp.]